MPCVFTCGLPSPTQPKHYLSQKIRQTTDGSKDNLKDNLKDLKGSARFSSKPAPDG
jgi:hypothetical protein